MKRIIPFVAAVLVALSAQAQTVNIRLNDGNIVKYFASEVEKIDFTRALSAPEGLEAVDLGLPSGTKWANMNVGATSVTETGLHFAWGETTGYGSDPSDGRSFDWESYEWSDVNVTTQKRMKKYNETDGKTILDPEDDAATVNWGSDWRMPTLEEIIELALTQQNTKDYEWTWCDGVNVKYEGSSVIGWKVMSKKAGTAGNHIFLPGGPWRCNDEVRWEGTSTINPDDEKLKALKGSYLSSELGVRESIRPCHAYKLYLYDGTDTESNYLKVNVGNGNVEFGNMVRPVHN